MDGSAAAAVVAKGVDLDGERRPLHALLRGEVGAQTVHRDEDLETNRGQRNGIEVHFWGSVTLKAPADEKH